MAPPPQQKCSHADCDWETPAGCPTWELVSTFLTQHTQAVHGGGQGQQPNQSGKLEKLPRPTFTLNMTESQWNYTRTLWDSYIKQTVVPEATKVMQLQAACDNALRQRVFDTGTHASLTTEEAFLAKMKELSVIVVHKSIHLRNLWKTVQQSDERVRAFMARVMSTADMCNMVIDCSNQACGQKVSYRDHVVMQVIIHGLRDNDIRVRVLSRNTSGELKTLDKLVDYIAAEEAGTAEALDLVTDSNLVGGIRRGSTYQQEKNKQKCDHCAEPRHGSNTQEERKKSCKAWGKKCDNCKRWHHFTKLCKSKARASPIEAVETNNDAIEAGEVGAMRVPGNFFSLEASHNQYKAPVTPTDISPILAYLQTSDGPVTYLPLPHYVHDVVKGWYKTRPRGSPSINTSFSLDRQSYAELGLNLPRLKQSGNNPGRSAARPSICDTGAQLTVIPQTLLDSMRIKSETIFPVETTINGASEVPIMVTGGILLKITAQNTKTGAVRHSKQLAYVSSHVSVPYLSLTACIDLGLVPASFPEVASSDFPATAAVQSMSSSQPQQCSNSGVPSPGDKSGTRPCNCPSRQLPPTSEPMLPCAPTQENLPILKKYILERYQASAFNCCEHQPLPLMDSSPPLRLFVEEDAVPVAVHTPSQVPLHWQEDVKKGLDRDCQLGVLEKVPVNDPVSWCSRMVITSKPDGSPRRVVDHTAVNKYAPRQTHHTEPPWAIVSSIPSGKVKSVVDCWHGYHSVPIHPADRHITTFITPWGRYRYRTSPQGLISAGDGYTHRKAEIMAGFENVKNCVDDSLIYDDTIEENFYRTCRFLEQGSRGGCTFNPKKFQFGESEVTFLGFLVTDTGVKPTTEFTQSILSFPTPKSLTDIRSWFGAINQISYSFAVAPVMAPFRHLLSSKVPFEWSEELQVAFDASKQEILRQCEHGVRTFDPKLPTALATDWAKLGIGYWLTQKHCSCPGDPTPGCCTSGWQTVYCGSRFCTPAESRYHPIEGEGQAIITGLSKCKFFILGLEDLILCIDHKPLLAILSDKQNLEDIPNPRIMNVKLKSMMYRFKAKYVPGKDHVIPDTFSRRHDSPINQIPMSNVLPGYSDKLAPPAWISPPTIAAFDYQAEDSSSDIDELMTGKILASICGINHQSSLSPLSSPEQPSALSWSRLEAACQTCEEYRLLHKMVQSGVSDKKEDWDNQIIDFFPHRQSLVAVGPVVMLHDRPIIPRALRQNVLDHLHAGHASATAMFERAATSLYWPNLRADMINYRAMCTTCTRYAPSNPAMPPVEPEYPTYPFQSICADFFHISPYNYLAIVDRYSNWLSVFKLPKDDSTEVIKVLREYIGIFGIPCSLTTDGAKVFTSKLIEEFCSRWGIIHRVSTAYNPQANKRSEVGVKSAKRLIRGNLTQTGELDNDKFARAILAHRNQPCSTTGLSPAQVVYGRVLRDFLPLQPGKFQPRPEWRQAANDRASAYAKRHIKKSEQLSAGSKPLPPLKAGDHVSIQNQTGNNPRQWQHTGVIIEVGPHNSYMVSVDGSRTITKRNRKFLRKIIPFQPSQPVPSIPTAPSPSMQMNSPTRPDTPIAPPSSPPSSPSHSSLPSPIEQASPNHQDDNANESQLPYSPSSTAPKSMLPPHLREKWIVAKEEPIKPIKLRRDADGNFTIVQDGSISPISSHPPSPYNISNNMMPITPMTYNQAAMVSPQTFPWYNPTLPNMLNSMTYQNVAQPNPFLLPYNMMPQQQPTNPSYYPSSCY